MYKHTAAHPDALSDQFLDAINTVQSTEWQVNDFILDIILEVRADGGDLGGMPSIEDIQPPEKLSDEQWQLMDQVERGEWKLKISVIHEDNAKMQSKEKA